MTSDDYGSYGWVDGKPYLVQVNPKKRLTRFNLKWTVVDATAHSRAIQIQARYRREHPDDR